MCSYVDRYVKPRPITTPAFLTAAHRHAQAVVRMNKQLAMFGTVNAPGIYTSTLAYAVDAAPDMDADEFIRTKRANARKGRIRGGRVVTLAGNRGAVNFKVAA